MGTLTAICLDGFDLVVSKNVIVPEVMSVFRESDRRDYLAPRKPELDGLPGASSVEVSQEPYRVIEYRTSAKIAILRLEVMGFTWHRARSEYEAIRESLIETAESDLRFAQGRPDYNDMVAYYQHDLELRRFITFEVFVAGFREAFLRKRQWYLYDADELMGLDFSQQYVLNQDHEDWPLFGFFCTDVRCFLRVALSVANADTAVTQSVGELIQAGWLEKSTPICDEAIASLVEKYPDNAPRIVLTEGSSDIEILSKSLQVLFPYMVGYYTFFDFHGARAAGGASQAIAVVKAFAASGVGNRVIALLDNDTAGREAQRGLKDVRLPKNLVVLHYPEREWLRKYPTLGPSGEEFLDVNGAAASIELYLGADVLMQDGKLFPVQWAGYSTTMKAYQGEVVSKERIRQAWAVKAERCIADPSLVVPEDWEDLKAIWQAIFDAFVDK